MAKSLTQTPSSRKPQAGVNGKQTDLARIRNIGIIAHIDAGKTTVTERVLYVTGRIRCVGEVHDGEATMDYLPEERERGITITSASTHCEWKGHWLNVIDTPGHVDFTAEVERSLRVLDGVVGVFCGVAGVEAQSETVWRQATRYGIPRLAFINKLDRLGADFDEVVGSIRERLGAFPVPIQWPIVRDSELIGLVDLIDLAWYRFVEGDEDVEPVREPLPAELASEAGVRRNAVIEAVADYDDALMARYLDGAPVAAEEIRAALREGTLSGGIVPVLGGSALEHQGIEFLLDAVCEYLPSPLNKPIVEGKRPGDEQHLIHLDAVPESPLCALAFKTIADPNGDLTFVRIYSGTLYRGGQVWNPRVGEMERIGRLFRMHADVRQPLDEAVAGDIVAVVGLKETATGDTLCDADMPVLLERITFPDTVVHMSVASALRSDRDRLGEVLARVSREDPTFRFFTDPETEEMIISGMGELHLEVICDRITRVYGLKLQVGQPQVAYRQTLAAEVEVEARHIKQTGGHGQYAVAHVRLGPSPLPVPDLEFEASVPGGRVPRQYFRSVEHGIRDAMAAGGQLRYPFVNVRADLFDGSYHEVDSSEMAFRTAGSQAFALAVQRAHTVLLEPIVSFDVQVPDEFLGSVLQDLQARRAQIASMDLERGVRVLRGKVPLAETFRYANALRGMTQGRGAYSFEPCEYAPVPQAVAEEVIRTRQATLRQS